MLTSELNFTAQLRKSVTLSRPLSLFFYSAWHRNASRLWCWPQKQVIKRPERGYEYSHGGFERRGSVEAWLQGEQSCSCLTKRFEHKSIQVLMSTRGWETFTYKYKYATTHTHTQTYKGYKIWLALFLFTRAKSITVNVLQLIWNTLANCDLKPRIVIPNQIDESALSLSLSISPFSLSSVYTHKPKIAVCFPHTEKCSYQARTLNIKDFWPFLRAFQMNARLIRMVSVCVCVCAHACVCVCMCVSDIVPREHQTVLQQLPADTRPVASRWPLPHTYTHTHTHTHTHTPRSPQHKRDIFSSMVQY